MSPGSRYLALLRGINVGGRNVVKMADLRAAFEQTGFAEVSTYIQSGNVLFSAPRRPSDQLAAQIESELSERFGTEIRAVVLTRSRLAAVVAGAPKGFGAETERCDVIFLRKPLSAAKAIAVVETREGVDRAWAGKGVLYFSRLDSQASRSRLSKITALPEYKLMTIRNWRTTTKLEGLLSG